MLAPGKLNSNGFFQFRNLLFIAIMLHLFLFVYGLFYPEIFLNADRAGSRFNTIVSLIDVMKKGGDIPLFLSTHGQLGDYFFHGILYALSGKYGVIVFQLGLALVSYYCFYQLMYLYSEKRVLAFMGALLYLLFSHTLVFPHQLISEAIFNPLLILSFYFLSKYLFVDKKVRWIVVAALFFGFANLVRPITMLFPFAVLVLLIMLKHKNVKHLISYTVISLLPLLAWMSFIYSMTGEFNFGKSHHDLESNLYDRAQAISRTVSEKEEEIIVKEYLSDPEGRLSAIRTAHFVLEYPQPNVEHVVKGFVVYFGKAGVNRLLVDVFGVDVGASQDSKTGWRNKFAENGFASVLGLFQEYPLVMVTNTLCSVALLFIMILFFVSPYYELRKKVNYSEKTAFFIIMFLFPFYLFLTSQPLPGIQSRHRSPGEFAIIFCSTIALYILINQKKSPRQKSIAG